MSGDDLPNSREFARGPVTGQPGSRPPSHPLDGEWFIHADGQSFGPFTGHQLRGFCDDGRLGADTDVVRVGSESWTRAADDRALAGFFRRAPSREPNGISAPPREQVSAAAGATVVQVTNQIAAPAQRAFILEAGAAKPKSAGTALVLSILLVGLGQIYNGQVGKAILMFILCVGLWFIFLGWIINIWSWIDAYRTARAMNDRYLRLIASGGML